MSEKKLIIQIPESEMLSKASLNNENLEEIVSSMFSNVENPGVTHVVVKSTADSEGAASAPAWERSC
ncbi:hypothetical protein [Mucilaginibacter sp. R-33]|uniref:hypothetical protein n=1 Tax=unclassified Mucilaginibacter TaxID=2617802 RepID=UPI003CF4893E